MKGRGIIPSATIAMCNRLPHSYRVRSSFFRTKVVDRQPKGLWADKDSQVIIGLPIPSHTSTINP